MVATHKTVSTNKLKWGSCQPTRCTISPGKSRNMALEDYLRRNGFSATVETGPEFPSFYRVRYDVRVAGKIGVILEADCGNTETIDGNDISWKEFQDKWEHVLSKPDPCLNPGMERMGKYYLLW